jgi:iduronate 2-sulfatase
MMITCRLLSGLACLAIGTIFSMAKQSKEHPNVLFIMMEDLRPELSMYGRLNVSTPNLDRIARRGTVFDIVGCQVAVCAPSRSSLLTGLSPETLGIYDFSHYGAIKHFRTIPSHFHRKGYATAMAGKIFHWESDRHWSHGYYGFPQWDTVHAEELKFENSSVTPDKYRPERGFYRDSRIIEHASRFLGELEEESESMRRTENRHQPWFLAVGLKGTHMQYQMPHRYWKQYADMDVAAMTGLTDPTMFRYPLSAPIIGAVKKTEATSVLFMEDEGGKPGRDRESYQRRGHGRTISPRAWAELYRGYLACLSYADAQLGILLDALESRPGLQENTIIVFAADHGMHVGEKGVWGKWSLFDEASRVPLIISDPGIPQSHGQHYPHPVENLDIFPTLVELAGVPLEETCVPLRSRKEQKQQQQQQHEQRTAKAGGGGTSAMRQLAARPSDRRARGPSRKHDSSKIKNRGKGKGRGRGKRVVEGGEEYMLEDTTEQAATREASAAASMASGASFHHQDVLPVPGEAPVRNKYKLILRHAYCDPLDGTSLAPLLRLGAQMASWTKPNGKDFALTQRMTCKTGRHTDIDANSHGWMDFCPFRKLPRNPRWGAMGYSLRSREWRYTAWLRFDTDTFLSSMYTAPLAEELYDHRFTTQERAASGLSNSKQVAVSTLGARERENLAHNNEFGHVLSHLRLQLYDYLFCNQSFEHLWQKRTSHVPHMRGIVLNRGHGTPHPQHALLSTDKLDHYFSYLRPGGAGGACA